MSPRAPWWFVGIIVLVSLPVLLLPQMMTQATGESGERVFFWLYPAYVVVAAICALITWRSNRTLSWILVALTALTDAAMWLLSTGYGQ